MKLNTKNITFKNLKKYSKKFNATRSNKVFKNVNTKGQFKKMLFKSDYMQNIKKIFENYIDVDTAITDQKNTGRCWIFAYLNAIRIPMIKKYNLENFEFSQAYLFFYEKLEKANFFLEYIIQNKNKNIDDEKIIHILKNVGQDGGDWDIFLDLIEKYGLVPKNNMDDQFHSSSSEELNTFLSNYLRKTALNLRSSKGDLLKLKNKILEDCYKILVIFLGEPPTTITWEYYEDVSKKDKYSNENKSSKKNKKRKEKGKEKEKIYRLVENITPLDFYKKYVPYNTKDKVCLASYPCDKVKLYNTFVVDLNNRVIGGPERKNINVKIEDMKESIMKSIDEGEGVWCGIDVEKFFSKSKGIMDMNAFNYKDVFGFDNIMSKCDGLHYRQSGPVHAMMFRGYNFKGNTQGFLVENSWGKDTGFDGNFFMSIDWFNKYCYQIVVDKKHVSKKILNAYKKKPVILEYNSPFGALLN